MRTGRSRDWPGRQAKRDAGAEEQQRADRPGQQPVLLESDPYQGRAFGAQPAATTCPLKANGIARVRTTLSARNASASARRSGVRRHSARQYR